MAYISGIKTASSQKVRLTFDDFSGGMDRTRDNSVLSMRFAETAYNFRYDGGALKEGTGLVDFFSLPEGSGTVLDFFVYKRYDRTLSKRDDRLIIFMENGTVFQKKQGKAAEIIHGFYLNSRPACVNYRLNSEDVLLVSSAKNHVTVFDGTNFRIITSSPKFISMCVHHERVFAIEAGEKSAVWFSDDFDPTNWGVSLDDAGFIEMVDERGALEKIVSFQNYVYVFREKGISRITAYAGQTEFSVSHLFVSGGKLFPRTLSVCGDRIIFLSEEGLCMFDGAGTQRLLRRIDGTVKSGNHAISAYCKGKYYVSFDMAFDDGRQIGSESDAYVNNALIVYDLATGNAEISRGFDICSAASFDDDLGERVAAALRGRVQIGKISGCGAIFTEAVQKRWDSPKSDIGCPDKVKTVRKLHIRTKYDCTVEVCGDSLRRSYAIKGAEGMQSVPVSVRGRLISFSFVSDTAKAEISRPCFDITI